MKSEIKIILESYTSFKQGNCFENMIRDVITLHRYEVKSNVNYTGMEIDLVAEHMDKSNETLYVECKAKEKVSSTELRNFVFNVNHKKADFGYFMRTKELEHQAAGLVDEMENDERYSNLTFFEPSKIIEMLKETGRLIEPKKFTQSITKRILAITHRGDFFIYLAKSSLGSLPTQFYCLYAKDSTDVRDSELLDMLIKEIPDLENLNQLYLNEKASTKSIESKQLTRQIDEIETISEVQESIDWHEYLPASTKNFVGRDTLRTQIFDFYKSVQENRIGKRIFYLTGKSGWGKSSMVADIRGRCKNKYYKNRFFTVAIDTRSSTSNNFVALSFQKLLDKAFKSKFIEISDFTVNDIAFTSNNDLLSSDSVQKILQTLKDEEKVTILIFDQFEDVFRKQGLFKSFYKFLSDVTDANSNLIVGFSWKTEILIPSENEAYHYWQQAKEQSVSFSVPEFGSKEVKGVIRQLEASTHKLSQEFKRRIIESSQGLPWLTKKLCIHIYHQLQKGVQEEKLISDNLNIEELFKSDIESVSKDELLALRYIAKKAVDGNFFDITELGEKIDEPIIESLRDKRMIIKSGSNYNIYWDIFRDYLVTNEVPTIGESYLLRQGVNLCFEVFSLFKVGKKHSIAELTTIHPKNIKQNSLENILGELRKLGLVSKVEKEELYFLTSIIAGNSKNEFISFMNSKFQNYTPYLRINNSSYSKISSNEIAAILKDIFKGNEFQDKTWTTYSLTLIGWFIFTELELGKEIIVPQKGRGKYLQQLDGKNVLPRNSKKETSRAIENIKAGKDIGNQMWRDLLIIGIIDVNRALTEYGQKVVESKNPIVEITSKIQQLDKMKIIKTKLIPGKKLSANKLIEILGEEFFEGNKISSKKIYANKALSWFK